MQRKRKALWMAAVIVGMLDLMVPTSQGQAPNQPPSAMQSAGSLKPPASGKINVAFVISEGADVMDIAGPWETLHGAMLTSTGKPWNEAAWDDMVMPINVYTVSDSLKPVDANGLTIVPNYTFDNAPKPQIIVIPAQNGRSAAQKAWLLANLITADETMSVCTGASVLADYGLLDGQTATTHHYFLQRLQKQYPAVHFVSGTRYVENGKIATAGGLTSGIDLALHIIARYYGDDVAQGTADLLEYRSTLWRNPEYEQVKPVVASK